MKQAQLRGQEQGRLHASAGPWGSSAWLSQTPPFTTSGPSAAFKMVGLASLEAECLSMRTKPPRSGVLASQLCVSWRRGAGGGGGGVLEGREGRGGGWEGEGTGRLVLSGPLTA